MNTQHYETHTGLEDTCSDMRAEAERAVAYITRVGLLLEVMQDTAYKFPKNTTEYYQLAETISECRRALTNAMEEILI